MSINFQRYQAEKRSDRTLFDLASVSVCSFFVLRLLLGAAIDLDPVQVKPCDVVAVSERRFREWKLLID